MKLHIAAAALAGMIGSVTAMAVPMVYGQGSQSCGEYVAATDRARNGDQSAVYPFTVWMSGYVSYASAVSGVEYFTGLDNKGVQLSMENYCRRHPLDRFVSAVTNLMTEIIDRDS
ncbi:hypothetical protein AC788_19615 [Pseudomonas sp. RIT-PI-a]|nr:hypothetical protein AC788_19615 [Pseudomonas sp. RIT-PI-a]